MALVVEDGTGLAAADALVSLADFQAYATDQGWDLTSHTNELQENAIRRGSRFISDAYPYKGTKLSRDQAFTWPRYGVFDLDGWDVDSDEVPKEIKLATYEASWREVQTVDSLRPDVTVASRVKKNQLGPLSKEFFPAPAGVSADRPDLKVIDDVLVGLLEGEGGAVLIRA